MNDIIMFYHRDTGNGFWYKTWAENTGLEYGISVKRRKIAESDVNNSMLATEEQASLTMLQLLEEAKKLYQ